MPINDFYREMLFDNGKIFPTRICVQVRIILAFQAVFFAQPTFVHVQRVPNFFCTKIF